MFGPLGGAAARRKTQKFNGDKGIGIAGGRVSGRVTGNISHRRL